MTYIGNRAFGIEIARDKVGNFTNTRFWGHIQSFGPGRQDLNDFGDIQFLDPSAPELMSIVSDNANDTVLGTGCRQVFIRGLDINGDEVEEILDMNGLTPVLTATAYQRLNVLFAFIAGSSERNEGLITATAATSLTIQRQIHAGEGITQDGYYTVPNGVTMYAAAADFNVVHLGQFGMRPIVEVVLEVRSRGVREAAWIQAITRELDTRAGSDIEVSFDYPAGGFPGLTDLKFYAVTESADTQVNARFTGVEVVGG